MRINFEPYAASALRSALYRDENLVGFDVAMRAILDERARISRLSADINWTTNAVKDKIISLNADMETIQKQADQCEFEISAAQNLMRTQPGVASNNYEAAKSEHEDCMKQIDELECAISELEDMLNQLDQVSGSIDSCSNRLNELYSALQSAYNGAQRDSHDAADEISRLIKLMDAYNRVKF